MIITCMLTLVDHSATGIFHCVIGCYLKVYIHMCIYVIFSYVPMYMYIHLYLLLQLFDNFDSGLEPLYPSLGVSDKEDRGGRAEGTGQGEDDSHAERTPLQGDKTPGNEGGMVKSRKRPHSEVIDASLERSESQQKPSSPEPSTGDHATKSRNDGPTQTSPPTPVCPSVVEPSPVEFPNSESSNVHSAFSEPPSKMKKVNETLQPGGSEDSVPVEATVKTKSRRHKKKKSKKDADVKQPYKVLHQ